MRICVLSTIEVITSTWDMTYALRNVAVTGAADNAAQLK